MSGNVSDVATKRETDHTSATLEERLNSETADIDEHAVATDHTAKGYGYEMKDDDGAIDPLDEMLDAYQSFLRGGMVEFANEVMGLIHGLQRKNKLTLKMISWHLLNMYGQILLKDHITNRLLKNLMTLGKRWPLHD